MCEHTHWEDRDYKKQQIGFDDFKTICQGLPRLKYIGIQGMGTPFLNTDFEKIIQYCYKQGYFVSLVESFSYIRDKHFDILTNYCVDRLDLSLDAGTRETYEKIRVKADFNKVIANLHKFREHKIQQNTPFPEVFWRFVSFDLNRHEIPDFIQIVKDLDLNLGHPTTIEIAGLLGFDKIQHLQPSIMEQDIVQKAEALVRGTHYTLQWVHTSNSVRPISTCAKWVQPFIMVNGDFVFDCAVMMSDNRNWLHNNAAGNCIKRPLSEIWEDSVYLAERAAVNNPEAPIPKWCVGCRGHDSTAREKCYGIMEYGFDVFPDNQSSTMPNNVKINKPAITAAESNPLKTTG